MNATRVSKHIFSSLVLLTGIHAGTAAVGHDHSLCEGVLPQNDLKIPVQTGMGTFTTTGITEEEFNEVIDGFEKLWKPVVETQDSKLIIKRYWSSPTVNASADVDWNGNRIINMYGGLARHRTITKDGFLLVVCHELGHHIGGAPKSSSFGWASNEGQSDYYGTLKCFRKSIEGEDSSAWLEDETVPATAVTACKSSFTDARDQAMCIRSAMAGMSLANLFADPDVMGGVQPKFDTPDPSKVSRTQHAHPQPQCRLDTYFQGALCAVDSDSPVSETDPNAGTCHERRQTNGMGLRPTCWFADAASPDSNIQ